MERLMDLIIKAKRKFGEDCQVRFNVDDMENTFLVKPAIAESFSQDTWFNLECDIVIRNGVAINN